MTAPVELASFPQLFLKDEVTIGNNAVSGYCCGRDFVDMVEKLAS